MGLRLGGGGAGSIPRSAFVFCGGQNVCVHNLCMGVSVHTALKTFTQLSSVIEGSNCVEELVQAHLETILFELNGPRLLGRAGSNTSLSNSETT